MTGAADEAGKNDLDQVLDAFVELLGAATFADSVRSSDDRASFFGVRPARATELRIAADRAEADARTALYGVVDHERAMRLIPRIGAVRYEAVARAEAAYLALSAGPDDGNDQ